MTVVCEFCDRSFTYNNKPESEEKATTTNRSTDNKNNNAALIVGLSHFVPAHGNSFDRSIRFCDFCEYAAVL